jgi:hypothetical protein
MSLRKTLLIGSLFATTVFAQQSASDVVSNLRNRYKAECAQIDATEAATRAQFATAYAKELARSRDMAQAKGDLDAVIQINTMITAANNGTVEAPPNTANAALRAAYTNYDRNMSAAQRPLSNRRQQLDANHVRELTTLEQQYTRSGLIEAAKLAREARIEVANVVGETKSVDFSKADAETISEMSGVVLTSGGKRTSSKSYKPPVEVEWRVETDGDFRIVYACDQIIFNWSKSPDELRIEGGPADNQNKKDAGAVPLNRIVSVKLEVLPRKMTLSVDGKERASWKADFSGVDQPVGVMVVNNNKVKVKQVTVRKLK